MNQTTAASTGIYDETFNDPYGNPLHLRVRRLECGGIEIMQESRGERCFLVLVEREASRLYQALTLLGIE